MSEPILEISDLRLSIETDAGSAKILDHVDLAVPRGRIVGLVGESGCGKSTLIRAILGILSPGSRIHAGEIRFDGRNLLTLDEATLRSSVRGTGIGFIPQDPTLAFNPVFTVGAQLLSLLQSHARATPYAQHRSHLVALLRRLGLNRPEMLLDRYPHQLSGGQRQRLLIGAALALSPRIIVADEPTTALDAMTQLQILSVLRRLADEFDQSLLFVTHDLGAAAQICDDIYVMYAGQIVESGPISQVLRSPLHPYSAALLDCHPERNADLAGIPGAVPSPLAPPSGCRFRPRCGQVMPLCAERQPRLISMTPDRRVDCRLFDT